MASCRGSLSGSTRPPFRRGQSRRSPPTSRTRPLGDAHALAILEEAGNELARTGAAALAKLFEPAEPAALSYAGNVFRAGAPLMEPFRRSLLEHRPGTELVPPAGDPLAGAVRLAGVGGDLRPEPGILPGRGS